MWNGPRCGLVGEFRFVSFCPPTVSKLTFHGRLGAQKVSQTPRFPLRRLCPLSMPKWIPSDIGWNLLSKWWLLGIPVCFTNLMATWDSRSLLFVLCSLCGMNLTLVLLFVCHNFVGGTSVFVGLQENLRWSHQHQKGGRGGKRRNCPRQSRRIKRKRKAKDDEEEDEEQSQICDFNASFDFSDQLTTGYLL